MLTPQHETIFFPKHVKRIQNYTIGIEEVLSKAWRGGRSLREHACVGLRNKFMAHLLLRALQKQDDDLVYCEKRESIAVVVAAPHNGGGLRGENQATGA